MQKCRLMLPSIRNSAWLQNRTRPKFYNRNSSSLDSRRVKPACQANHGIRVAFALGLHFDFSPCGAVVDVKAIAINYKERLISSAPPSVRNVSFSFGAWGRTLVCTNVSPATECTETSSLKRRGIPTAPFLERMEFTSASKRYSPEIRERAVWLVFEHEAKYDSQWAAIA